MLTRMPFKMLCQIISGCNWTIKGFGFSSKPRRDALAIYSPAAHALLAASKSPRKGQRPMNSSKSMAPPPTRRKTVLLDCFCGCDCNHKLSTTEPDQIFICRQCRKYHLNRSTLIQERK